MLFKSNFLKALTIAIEAYGEYHYELAEIYRNLALCNANNPRKSQEYLNAAYASIKYGGDQIFSNVNSSMPLLFISNS